MKLLIDLVLFLHAGYFCLAYRNTTKFLYMTLAIDIIDGAQRGLSNEARRELLLKKSKVMLC